MERQSGQAPLSDRSLACAPGSRRSRASSPIPPRTASAFPTVAVALLGLLLLPVCARAQSGRAWIEAVLRRTLTAAHRTNVRGTEYAFITPPRLPTVHVVRQVIQTRDGWSLLRWQQPDANRGTIIVDDGRWTRRYEPGTRQILITRSVPQPRDPPSIARQMRLILSNYSVRLNGTEMLAGRLCYVLTLKPYASVSHTVKLWVDTKTYFILGHQENSANGNTLATNIFTWVEYPRAIRPSEVRHPFPQAARKVTTCSSKVFSDIGQLRRATSFEVCVPYAMPGGYELERCELITTHSGQTSCLRFTDGMANISICQCPARETRPHSYRARQALLYQLGDCVVNYASGPMNFMLIGRLELGGLVAVTHVLNTERERVLLSSIESTFRVAPTALGAMRDRGIGLDTIVALHEIQTQAHCSMSTLIELCREGYDWHGIARRFNADVRRFVERVRYYEAR